jgi:hypothetical protein
MAQLGNITILRFEIDGQYDFPVYTSEKKPPQMHGFLFAKGADGKHFTYFFHLRREGEEVARSRFAKKLVSMGYKIGIGQ